MFSRLNATQKGMVLVVVPVVFQLLFIAAIYLPLHQFERTLKTMRDGKEILFALQENETELTRVLTNAIATGGNFSPEEAKVMLGKLRRGIVADNLWKKFDRNADPDLARAVELGEKLEFNFQKFQRDGVASWAKGWQAYVAWRNGPGVRTFLTSIQDQKDLTRAILDVERRTVAQQPEELAAFKGTLLFILWIGLFVSATVSVGLVLLFTREMLKRMELIERKANLLAVERTDEVEVALDEGTDEIAELDAALVLAAKKLNEARQRQAVVLDNSADVICSLDARLKFAAVGAASTKVWGYSSDELLGQSVLNILSPGTTDSTSAAFSEIRESSQEGKLENIILCSDGTMKDSVWSVSWSPERKAFYCVVHDVSELRAIEKLKQHFLSVASHDLRAPLTSVTLNVSIVTESLADKLTAPAIRELERVQNSAQRLSSLVNELLELDKLEAGKLGLELNNVDLSDACEAAKSLLFGLARQSNVQIVGPTGEALVRAEEKRLVQIISNLLSNAIKFSPEGGKVTISIESDGVQAELRVIDEGPGIDASDCATIFEKFNQARNSATATVKGTGLGLAVVKALVDSHGGDVGVSSELGKGSTFWVKLPLAKAASAGET
jgi:PAS domain S-box-containing protein